MTQAEYQWELLRRQRDYLAQKLASAAEVKRYAELAAKHHAGLEFASVTEDRAIVAQIHADLTDLIYMTIKGDLSAQAGETVDQALLRILATKSIDQTTIQTKTASLNEAIGLLNGITSQSAPDDAGIDSILSMFEAYLAKQGTNRNQNVLSGFSAKLTDYKQKLVGADQTTRDNLWTAIKSLASDLSSELQKVT